MPVTVMAAEVADRLRGAELTYREAGQTAGVLPPGYHHLRRSALIGSGPQTFADAASALLSWQVHLRRPAGVGVIGDRRAGHRGPAGHGHWAHPDRRAVPGRLPHRRTRPAGFAYGTLPGHPERGEEAFLIEQHHDGTVSFTITAFSRPATPLAKAAGPAGRAIQRHLTGRYLRALAS